MNDIGLRKDILRSNLTELNEAIGADLSLYFEDGGELFIVIDNKTLKRVMFENINRYDFTVEGQKWFIYDIGNKISNFFKTEDTMIYEKLDFVTFKDLYRLKGDKDYMFSKYKLMVGELDDATLSYISEKIKWAVDVAYDGEYIHVNIPIEEVDIHIYYVDENKKICKHPTKIYHSQFKYKYAMKTLKDIDKLLEL